MMNKLTIMINAMINAMIMDMIMAMIMMAMIIAIIIFRCSGDGDFNGNAILIDEDIKGMAAVAVVLFIIKNIYENKQRFNKIQQ